MLDHLRKLGMVVEVEDSRVILRQAFLAAEKGVPLTPEQAKVLVHMDRKTITFTIKLLCHWSEGQYEEL
jgi:mRNA turnover protein 4